MAESPVARVMAGTRVGLWRPSREHRHPFVHLGYYSGPDLGDAIVGTKYEQKLMDGELTFHVGVLFRPDLGRRQRLETVLLLENYIAEMWDYDTWEKVESS
jgi:hypothetical protein